MRPKIVCAVKKTKLRLKKIDEKMMVTGRQDTDSYAQFSFSTAPVWSEQLPASADGHCRPLRSPSPLISPGGLALIAVATASPPPSRRRGRRFCSSFALSFLVDLTMVCGWKRRSSPGSAADFDCSFVSFFLSCPAPFSHRHHHPPPLALRLHHFLCTFPDERARRCFNT